MDSAPMAQVERSGKFSFTIRYPILIDDKEVIEQKEYRTASGKFSDEDYEAFKIENPAAPQKYLLIPE